MPSLAVTVVGTDRPGIVNRVTAAIADRSGNLEDSSMSLLRGHFAMTLIADFPDAGAAALLLAARAAKEALHYLVMLKETLGDRWLDPDWFRFGASTLVNDIVRQLNKQESGRYAARYDVTES